MSKTLPLSRTGQALRRRMEISDILQQLPERVESRTQTARRVHDELVRRGYEPIPQLTRICQDLELLERMIEETVIEGLVDWRTRVLERCEEVYEEGVRLSRNEDDPRGLMASVRAIEVVARLTGLEDGGDIRREKVIDVSRPLAELTEAEAHQILEQARGR